MNTRIMLIVIGRLSDPWIYVRLFDETDNCTDAWFFKGTANDAVAAKINESGTSKFSRNIKNKSVWPRGPESCSMNLLEGFVLRLPWGHMTELAETELSQFIWQTRYPDIDARAKLAETMKLPDQPFLTFAWAVGYAAN